MGGRHDLNQWYAPLLEMIQSLFFCSYLATWQYFLAKMKRIFQININQKKIRNNLLHTILHLPVAVRLKCAVLAINFFYTHHHAVKNFKIKSFERFVWPTWSQTLDYLGQSCTYLHNTYSRFYDLCLSQYLQCILIGLLVFRDRALLGTFEPNSDLANFRWNSVEE